MEKKSDNKLELGLVQLFGGIVMKRTFIAFEKCSAFVLCAGMAEMRHRHGHFPAKGRSAAWPVCGQRTRKPSRKEDLIHSNNTITITIIVR